jgi:hypothetical protein
MSTKDTTWGTKENRPSCQSGRVEVFRFCTFATCVVGKAEIVVTVLIDFPSEIRGSFKKN